MAPRKAPCVPQPYSSRSSRRSSVSTSQGAVPIRAEAAARSIRVACELSQRKLPHARMRKKCMIDGYAAMLQARSQRHSRHCKRHSCTERCFCLSLSPICVSLVCMTIKREREREPAYPPLAWDRRRRTVQGCVRKPNQEASAARIMW